MKIQYVSDLHLEFLQNFEYLEANPIPVSGDILIMAGDIIPFLKLEQEQRKFKFFLEKLSSNYQAVFWLPGNHEYYNYEITGRIGSFKEKILDNIFLVNNHTEYFRQAGCPELRIIFSTLWSKIERENAEAVYNNLRDFQVIRYELGPFYPFHYNRLFVQSLSFLKTALNKPFKGRTIVVTHHVPTYKNYPKEYLNGYINNAFVTELEPLIRETNIDYWIYGHHHRNVPGFYIDKTRFLTNQLGYIHHGEGSDFISGKCITL